jgi:hypothetical protein
MNRIDPEAIEGSAPTYFFAKGKTLEERYRPLHDHILKRKPIRFGSIRRFLHQVLARRLDWHEEMLAGRGKSSMSR